jgi:RTX calcium-binding nonapeptide repeat (4 copies)
MAMRNINEIKLGVLELESREVPAILGTPQLVNGVVTVHCSDVTTTVLVTQSAGGVQVQDVVAHKTWSFSLAQVKRVDVFGGAGNDTITGRGNVGVRLRLYGGGGDDTIYGAPGRDIIDGGAGDDHLYGRGGNDVILGEAGDDYIDGGAGNDVLSGGDGDDQVNGGPGTDAISGDAGNDTLISIDGGTTDKVDGGPGTDVLWIDKTGSNADEQTGVDGLDIVHAVTGFANGASRTLGDGETIAEPATLNGAGYETFLNHPLFSPNDGPTIDDIVQSVDATGKPVLDDSWLLSGLGAIVNEDPALITQNMVDFGDGTYGVALGGFFFRVDNQLPVTNVGQLNPAYAGLGVDNSIWVPILEKAYADYQAGTNDYAALNGTGGANPAGIPNGVFSAFGFTPTSFSLSQFFSTTQLGSVIKTVVNNDFPAAIAVTALPTPPANQPALIAGQDYTLLSYHVDALGDVTSVVLRNPMGIDGGGSMDSDPNDGILTININDLLATSGTIQFGTP